MERSYYVHPLGIVEPGAQIGDETRVWAFAHVLSGAQIGAECNICDHVFIENDVHVGNQVTIKSGVQLWDGVTLGDSVFVGPNVAFTNDPFPRSKQYPESFARTVIQKGASLGANATILPGIQVGRYAMVGAGAVVTRNVPPFAVVTGNPARVQGFVDADGKRKLPPRKSFEEDGLLSVSGARIVKLKTVIEPRGSLSVAEFGPHLPFLPKRYFVVSRVPAAEVRGMHAHRLHHQFLTCLGGSCHVMVDDGSARDEVVLDSPECGLYIPPLVWATQYKYSADAALLVLTSDLYDPADYIHNYEEFLSLVVAG